MSGQPSDSENEHERAFAALFAEDRARGVARNVADYFRLFPDHEDLVAAAYVRLTNAGAPSSASETFADTGVGGTIGPYRILKELGRGGQGAVYLAEDSRVKREVALKVLTNLAHLSPLALERFRREALIASKLDHPGICPVYDVGFDRGAPYLAMKLIRGETLAQRIAAARDDGAAASFFFTPSMSRGGLDATQAADPRRLPPSSPNATVTAPEAIAGLVRLVEQAARALHAAHEAGVVHRDVKPGNIMVTSDDAPTILDFGLAHEAESDAPTLTQTGDLMGTPAYMSPEQIASHHGRIDRRTDVYSLGVTLYECLTLRRPFEAPTREGLFRAILTKDPPDVRRLNPAASDDLRVVVETALEKDRDRRYATALDFAEELRRVRMHEPIRARPAGPLLKLGRWMQRNPALAAALCGLFVVLAAGLTTSLILLERRDLALDLATTERNAKAAALDDYDRLGDVSRLAHLVEEAENLWPAEPGEVAAMRAWLEEAERLERNLPGHRAVRDALRASGDALPYGAEDRAADAAKLRPAADRRAAAVEERRKIAQALSAADPSESTAPGSAKDDFRAAIARLDTEISALDERLNRRLTWRFRTASAQFKHDAIGKLVDDLAVFLDPDPYLGAVASVRKRLSFATTVEAASLAKHAERWAEAGTSIADPRQCPQYRGLKLAPQLGLVPIRKDPRSGLWEFAHLASTAEGTGPFSGAGPAWWWEYAHLHRTTTPVDPIPAVRPDGRYDLRETTGVILVLLPGDTFRMGARRPTPEEQEAAEDGEASPPNVAAAAEAKEGPVHDVALEPFFMSKYELTQGQWLRLVGRNPSQYPAGSRSGGRALTFLNPVEEVSWDDCAGEHGRLERLGLELPTEAQWEYACRAGTTTPWWCGAKKESLREAANVADAYCRANGGPPDWPFEAWSDGYTVHAPIGSFAPNGFGLHDMAGNVWEWCRDGFAPYTPDNWRRGDGLRDAGPAPPTRVYRGGCMGHGASDARSSYRYDFAPSLRSSLVGVRPSRRVDAR